jgi:hypothetical protein
MSTTVPPTAIDLLCREDFAEPTPIVVTISTLARRALGVPRGQLL